MSEQNVCPIEVHEQRFKTIENDVSEIKINVSDLANKFVDIDKTVAVKNNEFETALAKLSTLPDILTELKISNNNITKDVNSNIKNIDDIKTQINTVDDEGKFNIRLWIRDNWASAVLAIGGFIAIITNLQK